MILHRTGIVASHRTSQILALQHSWTIDQRVLRTIPFPEGVRGDEDRVRGSAIQYSELDNSVTPATFVELEKQLARVTGRNGTKCILKATALRSFPACGGLRSGWGEDTF